MKVATLALCVPAYNAAPYLPRLLKSVYTQTIPFDEVWIYDDCSNDDTAQVAEKLGAIVVRGEVNRGCSYGKNRLAELTQCEWIHFHDADDELYPHFVETAHKWMLREDAPDIVLFGYEYRDNDTHTLLAVRRYDDSALREDPICYTLSEKIIAISGIYKRLPFLRVGGHDLDPRVLYNEDVALHCRLAKAGLRFRADPTVTIINYRRSNSMSQGNPIECVRAHYHVLKKVMEGLEGRYSKQIAQKLWELAGVAGSYLDWDTADAAVNLAVKLTGRIPLSGDWRFRVLCLIDPRKALRIRELYIRILKPGLRRNKATVSNRAS